MDSIRLTGVRAEATHGVLDFEHVEPQPFIVDATMFLDLSEAGASDDLAATVDYGQIAKRIVNVIEGEHVDLIERLATKIADSILLSHRIQRVIVTVHKPNAPIKVPFGDVSVTIERSRDPEPAPVTAASQAAAAQNPASNGAGADGRQQDSTPHTAVIAMGGNLGDVEQTLRAAVVAIDGVPGNQVNGISPLYRTAAWGMEPGTPDFLNAVVELTTTLDAETLLQTLQTIEAAHGRSREVHWGSRPLDLDIIDFDGETSADPHLTLPHPRAWQRAFVLAPWADLEPEATLAGPHGGTVADLLAQTPDRDRIEKVSDSWILGGSVI
ncbi:2-amino-4-hydroxy-6-hydroxymethyldihydropteridine diphosphokinase [Bifidobacterium sp. SMB2]|uniref:Bifunctional folate synthesis protein n=1 Tax=Bifidobacterium saimiriisciurei TaxID=2661627 RepID=A0ABX0CE08_9BIFI|nr:2-amino-4-hydroxy-6-hydroxymethyldihydropteridine diphosphokinase [Bifidobacterium sp. SMB2]NEG96653.1 2-amino-4-hydroxy-6-hydroxymethyldihydropteridine diphosphokinase [Bifidobacterium sp. SMB2]NEH12426.1 2-amino-4-hydroxy-6-hydroxymethyldihydropteridine diphosphokinase [Bifidobacterium saimiriisciurei]